MRVKQDGGVLAGVDVARRVFKMVDRRLKVTVKAQDGARLKAGDVILIVEGRTRSILTAERVALNFVQRLSGIATLTAQFVEKTKGTRAKVYDTRKTLPGLRILEKYAVTVGGGFNHRSGLYDQILIKDNHIDAAGSITKAVEQVRAKYPGKFIEVEVRNLDELREAVALGVDCILLDNMSLDDMRRAVEIVHVTDQRKDHGTPLLEASGGVTLATVGDIALIGVDRIAVGLLTHSAPALDINLKIGVSGVETAARYQWYSWASASDKARVLEEGVWKKEGNILQVGLWDEAFTALLVEKFPRAKIVGVDRDPHYVAAASKK
jgi:nicotinate-nucleotide pyrophosphorylase (carboxylating)